MSENLPVEGARIDVSDYTFEQLLDLVKKLRGRGQDVVLAVQGVPQEQMDGFMAEIKASLPGARIEPQALLRNK